MPTFTMPTAQYDDYRTLNVHLRVRAMYVQIKGLAVVSLSIEQVFVAVSCQVMYSYSHAWTDYVTASIVIKSRTNQQPFRS